MKKSTTPTNYNIEPVNILQQHSVKYSATTMLISVEPLIYIAEWLVVIVVSSVQIVKPHSRLSGLHLLECLLGLDAVLKPKAMCATQLKRE